MALTNRSQAHRAPAPSRPSCSSWSSAAPGMSTGPGTTPTVARRAAGSSSSSPGPRGGSLGRLRPGRLRHRPAGDPGGRADRPLPLPAPRSQLARARGTLSQFFAGWASYVFAGAFAALLTALIRSNPSLLGPSRRPAAVRRTASSWAGSSASPPSAAAAGADGTPPPVRRRSRYAGPPHRRPSPYAGASARRPAGFSPTGRARPGGVRLLVDVADDEEHRAEDRDQVRHQRAGQQAWRAPARCRTRRCAA